MNVGVRMWMGSDFNTRTHPLYCRYNKYFLRTEYRSLQDYEIIIACDDSGSMKTTVDSTISIFVFSINKLFTM